MSSRRSPNYTALIHDHLFINGLLATAFFAVAMVTLQLGVDLALALHRLSRYQQLLATVLLIPSILSPSVVGSQWLQLFNYSGGLLNYFLHELHLPLQTWNASPRLALPSLLVVDFWEWTPFMVLLLFAGLWSIPQPIFEAARVDGSSGWQILRYHTLPPWCVTASTPGPVGRELTRQSQRSASMQMWRS